MMASEVVCGLIFRLILPVCLAAGKTNSTLITQHVCNKSE